jgi:hypothetical protein
MKMGRKKSTVKIAKIATVRCPQCGKNSRLDVPSDRIVSSFECKHCKQKILTPPAYCCIICAFSKKKCTPSQMMEAKIKGLEIKHEKKETMTEKPKVNLFLDENIG